MRIIPALVLFAAFIIPSILAAQNVNIKGKVLLETGDPLPFATIMIKGARVGTTSDKDGNFSLSLSKIPSILFFSAVGYETVTREITKENAAASFRITMKKSTASLDE